ncbi:hypothetical protein AB0A71_22290 [Kitasatospora aureofaciens]|uniref:hypothetical protein n=1 Tax=Kitasatospora aureofaciens TaxID=1894 RepID=UPI0033DCA3CA
MATSAPARRHRLTHLLPRVVAAAGLAVPAVVLRRHRTGDLGAWLVAACGLGEPMLRRYVDAGTLGPLPNMYEPIRFDEKIRAACAEGIAIAALTVPLLGHRRRPV